MSRALVAEGLGEGVPQLLVVGLQFADPLVCELQALPEGAVAGGLPGGHGRDCRPPWAFRADLGEQVGLGVQPGSGYPGALREHADRDGLLGGGQVPQGADGTATGLLRAGAGGLGDGNSCPRRAMSRDS